MARKRFSDEGVLNLLRRIEVDLSRSRDGAGAWRTIGFSDATHCTWRKTYDGIGWSQLRKMKAVEKETTRLKKIAADLHQVVIRVRQKRNTSERRTCRPVGTALSAKTWAR